MKTVKMSKAFIFIVLLVLIYNAYSISVEENGQYNYTIADLGNIADTRISNKNESKKYVYKNTFSHPVTLSNKNVNIECKGKTKNDEQIAKQNTLVNVIFQKNNEKFIDKVTVNSNEEIKIYLTTSYTNEYYPDDDVKCNYKFIVNIH